MNILIEIITLSINENGARVWTGAPLLTGDLLRIKQSGEICRVTTTNGNLSYLVRNNGGEWSNSLIREGYDLMLL